jgi:hypothetical protein
MNRVSMLAAGYSDAAAHDSYDHLKLSPAAFIALLIACGALIAWVIKRRR